MIVIIIILFLIVFYIPILWTWNHFVEKRLPLGLSKGLKITHYVVLFLTLVHFILVEFTTFSFVKLEIPYYTTVVFFITGIFNYSICDRSTFGKFERIYFLVFTYLPVVLVTLLFFPITLFFMLGDMFQGFNLDNIQTIYSDHNIRVEADFSLDESWGSFTNINLQVYKKVLLFKKKLVDTDIMALDVSEIKVSYDPDSTRITIYKTFDPNFSRTDTVSIAKD